MATESNVRTGKIIGYKDYVTRKRVSDASTEGVQYLTDLRYIEDNYGVPDTFDYDGRHLDFELFLVFHFETALCLFLSLFAVLFVVLIITSSPITTLLVATCVAVTDFFLVGFIYFWGLTLNQIVVLNIIVAVGTSVDYSTHIAYAYLVTKTPKECDTPRKIRSYKIKKALQTMGSSVWHGGFSTFVAIIVLSPS